MTLGKSLLGQSLSFLPCKMGKEAGREGVGDSEALLSVSIICLF